MSDCVFCKIVSGEIPSFRFWEDEEFFAILDIFPNCSGQSLVIPKRHADSDLFLLDEETYARFLLATKKVAGLLKEKLGVQRIAMIMEGMGVDHLHIKLYPLHGVEGERKEYVGGDTIFFDQYPGYVTTELGPKADMEVLQMLHKKLSS